MLLRRSRFWPAYRQRMDRKTARVQNVAGGQSGDPIYRFKLCSGLVTISYWQFLTMMTGEAESVRQECVAPNHRREIANCHGRVAELADARDLKSRVRKGRGGSSPPSATSLKHVKEAAKSVPTVSVASSRFQVAQNFADLPRPCSTIFRRLVGLTDHLPASRGRLN